MIDTNALTQRNALYATMCAFLGPAARDLAEIGGFLDRFARDLIAGRRPFPSDTNHALDKLQSDLETITRAMVQDFEDGIRTVYIYRTNEQLRTSQVGNVWPARGKSRGGFIGPYRAAVFKAWCESKDRGIEVELKFADTP